MAEKNTSDIVFEKQIWNAACVLCGNLDVSEYKSVVMGLIFLKYIANRFEVKYQELVEEGEGFEEDIDEYTANNIFFVPEDARWNVIVAAALIPEIGSAIDEAIRAIEKENKRLKDILPKNFARSELDKWRLGGCGGLVYQHSDVGTWKLAQMNLAICGIEANLGKYNADTFFDDCHPQLKAEFVMANRQYYVYRYKGKLNSLENAVALIACPKGTFHKPQALRTFCALTLL